MANQLIEATIDDLIHRINTGQGNWLKEWVGGGAPTNYTTKAHYHGMNILLLWSQKQEHGYPTNKWATYKQWSDAGFQVQKGERSSIIFIAKDALSKDLDEDGERKAYRLLKCAFVFNAAQLVAPPPQAVVARTENERILGCEQTVVATGALIDEGDSPSYYRGLDYIEMPGLDSFISTEAYYCTLFHELTHWTGAPNRLDRDMRMDYAFEELVAEFGACFLCAEHGIDGINDNASNYLRGWLKDVKGDKGNALMRAAAAAGKAMEFILAFQSKKEQVA